MHEDDNQPPQAWLCVIAPEADTADAQRGFLHAGDRLDAIHTSPKSNDFEHHSRGVDTTIFVRRADANPVTTSVRSAGSAACQT